MVTSPNVCMHHTKPYSNPQLNNQTPIKWLLGHTLDIMVLLQFQFWKPVYYAKYNAKFPSDSMELLVRFVGIAEHVGSAMTFKILSREGNIIHRSIVQSAAPKRVFNNKRANADTRKYIVEKDAVTNPETILSKREDHITTVGTLPTIDTSTLLGRTFINNPDKNGEQACERIDGIEFTGKTTPDGKQDLFRFRSKVGEKTYKNIMTYNKTIEWCIF